MDDMRLSRLAPVVALSLLAVTAGIIELLPAPDQPVPTATDEARAPAAVADGPAAVAAASGDILSDLRAADAVVVARRGTLAEVLTFDGRVGAVEEITLSFRSPQRISEVKVGAGDRVSEGDVLIEADGRELARSLSGAQERLTAATMKLNQAEEQATAQQQLVERRQAAATARSQRILTDAEAAVRRAEADLERVRAGATPAERRAAETAVVSARASLARAEADLARARQGPAELDVRQAEQQIVTAQLALSRAKDEYERLTQGPDPQLVQAAEREFVNAQNGVARAQLDLERLMAGDPVAVGVAQRDVERAQTALRLAELNARSSGNSSGMSSKDRRAAAAERQAAVQNARLALQDANDRLQRLRAGPAPGEIAIAQRNLVAATSLLQAARDRLEVIRQGPDEAAIAQARAAVDSAQLAYDAAVARLSSLQAGPDEETLSAATAAYQSTQAALASAVAQQRELLARPTRAELSDATDRLGAAQEALEQAQIEAELAVLEPQSQDSPDLELLRQAVAQEQAAVQALERDMMDAHILAPVGGTVIVVTAKAGAGVDAGQPVVVLARDEAEPVVLADMAVTRSARLSVGQAVSVTCAGDTSRQFPAAIADITGTSDGAVRVQIRPTWTQGPPAMGTPASIQAVLQERPDVVILPERALQGTGRQRSAEVAEGDGRHTVQVDVGLIAGGDAEILSGIEPGTSVFLPR